MAFSAVTARGSAVDTVNDNSIALTPSAALTVGKLVVVHCVSTNIATADGSSSTHSLADSKNNNWTKIAERTETVGGVAHDGSTHSLWYTVVSTEITTGDTITLTTTAASAEKIISAVEATFDNANNNIALETVASNAGITATVSGMPSRAYFLVGAGAARGSDIAKTPDADYTEQHDLRSRNNAAAITSHQVTRIATLTTDTCTSSAWTLTTSTDCFMLAALYESAATHFTANPTTGSLTATGQAPPISLGSTLAPTTASTVITGQAPTFAAHHTALPGIDTLIITGFEPTLPTGLTERLTPNTRLAGGTNLRDTLTNSPPTRFADIDEPTGSDDGEWWTAINVNTDIDIRLGFPTSSGNLTGTQSLRVLARGTMVPARQLKLELWEAGSKKTSETTVAITSTTGQVVTLNFPASELTDVTGAGVEIRILTVAA